MVNFIKAIKRPFDSRKLLIGLAVILLAFVLYFIPLPYMGAIISTIAFLVFAGYVISTIQHPIKRNFELPVWKKPTKLFIDGLLAYVIQAIYSIPLIAVALVSIYAIKGQLVWPIDMALITGARSIAVWVVFVLTLYIFPSSIVAFGENRKFSDAFKRPVIKGAFNGRYLSAWILGIVYVTIAGFISAILAVSIIVPLLFIFVAPITFYTLLAEAWGKANRR